MKACYYHLNKDILYHCVSEGEEHPQREGSEDWASNYTEYTQSSLNHRIQDLPLYRIYSEQPKSQDTGPPTIPNIPRAA